MMSLSKMRTLLSALARYLPAACAGLLLSLASLQAATLVSGQRFPGFSDDLDYEALIPALERSLTYLQRVPPASRYTLGERRCSPAELIASIRTLRRLVAARPKPEQLRRQLRRLFEVYQADGLSGSPKGTMLVTSYYQPHFAGSLEPSAEYAFPLYSLPNDLVLRHGGGSDPSPGREIGRLEGGRFVPYWTRGEIEEQRLLFGQELVWLRSPLDAFILHIQGSGLITLRDGRVLGVHYALRNGRPYRSIGKLLVESGRMRLEEASMTTIRTYLTAHPQERDQVLHHNESFIFFKWSTSRGAVGSIGQELTPGRSIAADQRYFPPGAPAFLISRKPLLQGERVVGWDELRRFVTIQDSGSAIKGPGRVDLFWGSGAAAGNAAGRMKEDGALYILLLKENPR
ncbi:murein transglycosylase A [Desulfogranum mediterraneum]|uniref:murein transglycosylase A n=1 Tax=Desulfogranum mediterraneum TaxID=160661 RepID=UPI0013791157|nr:murein transglycosylase A [Desulfogranum mediterraneum]